GFFVLARVNPFRFIIPGLVYPIPVRDSREVQEIYLFSSEEKILKKIKKKLYISESIEQNIKNLSFAISGHKELREEVYLFSDAEILPNLGYAVKKVWFYNENQSGKLIIDLREETLEEELALFFKDRQFPEYKTKSYFLDAYFDSLTRSILSIEKDVKIVIYLIDGEGKRLPDMRFNLAAPHISE
ncbi:MAG: hypothetical protein OEZ34_09965, partial [Spirochaetia bacterium]|nr:hypothetical protein [Spirochaetia bacterium]